MLCGKIGICRWVYQCEQSHRPAPWDAKLPLSDKYTRRVAEIMCRLAAHFDYRAAAELSHQGIEVSHTTLHRWSSTRHIKTFKITLLYVHIDIIT